jgi:hypothetical protein
VARFNSRSQVREGQTIEIAVDVRALHFFDTETGLGIYDMAEVTNLAETPEPAALDPASAAVRHGGAS